MRQTNIHFSRRLVNALRSLRMLRALACSMPSSPQEQAVVFALNSELSSLTCFRLDACGRRFSGAELCQLAGFRNLQGILLDAPGPMPWDALQVALLEICAPMRHSFTRSHCRSGADLPAIAPLARFVVRACLPLKCDRGPLPLPLPWRQAFGREAIARSQPLVAVLTDAFIDLRETPRPTPLVFPRSLGLQPPRTPTCVSVVTVERNRAKLVSAPPGANRKVPCVFHLWSLAIFMVLRSWCRASDGRVSTNADESANRCCFAAPSPSYTIPLDQSDCTSASQTTRPLSPSRAVVPT